MLGVFLLPAFTRQGHERQDLLSPAMKCMCAQTRPWFILSSERVLGGMEFEPMLTPREKIPSTGKCPQRRIEPATMWTASPNTTNELFQPPIPSSPDVFRYFLRYTPVTHSFPVFLDNRIYPIMGETFRRVAEFHLLKTARQGNLYFEISTPFPPPPPPSSSKKKRIVPFPIQLKAVANLDPSGEVHVASALHLFINSVIVCAV